MIKLCKSLYKEQANEKDAMNVIFEREFRREKQLEFAKNMNAKAAPKGAKDTKTTIDDAKKLQGQK